MSRIKNWDLMYKSKEHERCWNYKTHAPELAAIIASGIIPDDANILDVGCGTGSDAVFLSSLGYKTTAIDISAEAIKIASMRCAQLNESVEWKVGNVVDTRFPEKSFDFIYDRGCLHHINEDKRDNYALEMARILKDEGILLIVGSRTSGLFIPIIEATVSGVFKKYFTYKRVVPLMIVTDSCQLEGNMVLLRKNYSDMRLMDDQ